MSMNITFRSFLDLLQFKSLTAFFAQTPLFIQKDDHDILKNDVSPYSSPFGELTFEDGLSIWYEQVPVQEKPYCTLQWGKDLQVWIVEGREYRSDNHQPDGPEKTIWGKEQKEWFVKTVKASEATFKILVSPTPVVGPDRIHKKDNHANLVFKTEGDWLRQFLSDNDVFIVCGDRHWQYVSQDKKTGVMEFSSGPASDAHAQGWKQSDLFPEHKFLRVKGGFLAVKVYRENNSPVLKFTHYDVDGNIVNEEVIKKYDIC